MSFRKKFIGTRAFYASVLALLVPMIVQQGITQFVNLLDNELLSLSAAVGEDGTVLGYAEVRVILDEGTLERIAVAPRYRRQGIAEALLDAYIQYGREHLAFLTLEVRAGNAPAIALYEKLGFREVGRRKNYYRAEHEDALLMTVEFDRHG